MTEASYGYYLVLTAILNGHPIRLMVDTGATASFVSTRFAAKHRNGVQLKKKPYPLTMADGSPVEQHGGMVIEELRAATLTIAEHQEIMTLDVVTIKYDLILGIPWLESHNPQIDWKKRDLTFPNCRHGTTGVRSTPKVPFIKAIWVRPQGRMLAFAEVICPPEYQEFEELFEDKEGTAALPNHKPWDHEIPIMEGKTPTHYGGLIPTSAKEDAFSKEYIEKHLAKGFIRASQSSIAHGMLFVPKKDGSLRPCIDYRKLNELTKKNRYPLPRIDILQDRLLGAVWFTAIDIRDAYYRVRMKAGEEWKTAFRTRYGLYEYLVMPFGLTNAPATFQELINNTLREYLDNFVVAYLDDVLIFSRTYEEHVQHVKKVLKKLQEAELPIKLSKCEFHKHQVKFLGYVVSSEGLGPDPDKIKSVQDWPEPSNVKDVQGFVGLANFYRRFIEGFSKVAAPLTALTKKGQIFDFGKKCQEAFNEIKKRITAAPILLIFDPEKEVFLETDASDYAIGACICQKDKEGKLKPVAYYSRKMTGPELNYDIHDKELLAIVEAFREWRVYLEGSKYPVQVYTDHKNLLYWTTTKQLNRRQVRWSETLASYSFQITHVRGTENGRADALSRRPDYEVGTKPSPGSLLKAENGYLTYSQPQLALMEGRPCRTDSEKQEIIRDHHDLPAVGHPGINKTIELVTRNYSWPGLRKDVESYVKECDLCAKTKHSRHKPYGLLQSPKPPEEAWKSIAWDFIVKLPKSPDPLTGVEYDSILVIVDRLTKYAYFMPYLEASNAEQLASTFLRTVFANHGMPDEIISDRDKLFTSQFWQSLTDQLGIKHKLSTSFHPQTDGQTERTNQTLEQYLRCYVNYRQTNWVQLLPLAQFAFNNSDCVTGVSPFYANYGFHPKAYGTAKGLKPIAQKASVAVEQLTALHDQLSKELAFIAEKSAKFANRKRSEGPDLKKGDPVYLLRRNIKTKRPSDKLDHTKLGPFKIEEKLGPVTFKLKLPETMRIHPVFHISLLEPAPQNARQTSVDISEELQEQRFEVERILDCQDIDNKPHYLIKWTNYPESDNTWEPTENLTRELVAQYHRQNPKRQTSLSTRSPEHRRKQSQDRPRQRPARYRQN